MSTHPIWRIGRWFLLAAVMLGLLIATAVVVVIYNHDQLLNSIVKKHFIELVEQQYHGSIVRVGTLRAHLQENIIECDSLFLANSDSSLIFQTRDVTVRNVDWKHVFVGSHHDDNPLSGADVSVHAIYCLLPGTGYALNCDGVTVSSVDSTIIIDSLNVDPTDADETFFAAEPHRKTRVSIGVGRCKFSGVNYPGAVRGTFFRMRKMSIGGLAIDVLINKDKPIAPHEAPPMMPLAALYDWNDTLQVDSVIINDADMLYGERFAVRAKPATLNFSNVHLSIAGIANHVEQGTAINVDATGTFINTSPVTMHMSLPLGTPDNTFDYSGTLGAMDLQKLNRWLVTAEYIRVKTGVEQHAEFNIHVNRGTAGGTVHAVYRDLRLAMLSKKNHKEEGIGNWIASLIANAIKLHTTNIPDSKGAIKFGKVKYVRRADDPFFKLFWFSLRSGLSDLVGF